MNPGNLIGNLIGFVLIVLSALVGMISFEASVITFLAVAYGLYAFTLTMHFATMPSKNQPFCRLLNPEEVRTYRGYHLAIWFPGGAEAFSAAMNLLRIVGFVWAGIAMWKGSYWYAGASAAYFFVCAHMITRMAPGLYVGHAVSRGDFDAIVEQDRLETVLRKWLARNHEVDSETVMSSENDEVEYYERIEDFQRSSGHYETVLEAQGTDPDFWRECFLVYKCAYQNAADETVVGALVVDAAHAFRRNPEYAMDFLQGVKDQIRRGELTLDETQSAESTFKRRATPKKQIPLNAVKAVAENYLPAKNKLGNENLEGMPLQLSYFRITDEEALEQLVLAQMDFMRHEDEKAVIKFLEPFREQRQDEVYKTGNAEFRREIDRQIARLEGGAYYSWSGLLERAMIGQFGEEAMNEYYERRLRTSD